MTDCLLPGLLAAREIDVDALLEQIERLDAFCAGLVNLTKVADHVHVSALRVGLPEIVEKMKTAVDWERRV